MKHLIASVGVVLGLAAAAGPAGADAAGTGEYRYLYAGAFGGTCGEACAGLEIFGYNPGAAKVFDYVGGRGSATKVGGLTPIVELSGGMNIAHPVARQHVQLGVVAGAYFLGARATSPTESNFGVAGGLELAYSLRIGKLHVRPTLRGQWARGEAGSTMGTATGTGPLVIADLHVVVPMHRYFLAFAHVGFHRLSLTGTLDRGGTATHEVRAPYVHLGLAF